METYIKNKKAMEILGIKSKDTLKRWLANGLKSYGNGAKRRFLESDIKEYMENKLVIN